MVSGSTEWLNAPSGFSIHDHDVHVWRISLKNEYPEASWYEDVLSIDEKDKSRRYRFQHSRNDYVITRSVLRHLLGRYLHKDPKRIQFTYNPFGKPSLVIHQGDTPITFNVSHSNEYALIAFTKRREIGVDVEHIRPEALNDKVAESFFSKKEVSMLSALPPELQVNGFFNCWTRKEAYIKAKGEGLTIPLNQFDVSLHPDEPAALLHSNLDPTDVSRWTLLALRPGFQHAGAVAVAGKDLLFRFFNWSQPGLHLPLAQHQVYLNTGRNSKQTP